LIAASNRGLEILGCAANGGWGAEWKSGARVCVLRFCSREL